MIVVTYDYPVWMIECGRCKCLAGLPVAAMTSVLGTRHDRRLKAVSS
jgi:hypothetical protein